MNEEWKGESWEEIEEILFNKERRNELEEEVNPFLIATKEENFVLKLFIELIQRVIKILSEYSESEKIKFNLLIEQLKEKEENNQNNNIEIEEKLNLFIEKSIEQLKNRNVKTSIEILSQNKQIKISKFEKNEKKQIRGLKVTKNIKCGEELYSELPISFIPNHFHFNSFFFKEFLHNNFQNFVLYSSLNSLLSLSLLSFFIHLQNIKSDQQIEDHFSDYFNLNNQIEQEEEYENENLNLNNELKNDFEILKTLKTNANFLQPSKIIQRIIQCHVIAYVISDHFSSSSMINLITIYLTVRSFQLENNLIAVTKVIDVVNEKNNLQMNRKQKRLGVALYPFSSLINHSCSPSFFVSFDEGLLLSLRATRDVKEGEEVTISYGPIFPRDKKDFRLQTLKQLYYFTCTCPACSSSEKITYFKCLKNNCEGKLIEMNKENFICSICSSLVNCSKMLNIEKRAKNSLEKGDLSLDNNYLSKAKEFYLSSLSDRSQIYIKSHQSIGQIEDRLAQVFAMEGNFKESSLHSKRSLTIVRENFGANSPEYANELAKLSQLLFNAKEVKEGIEVTKEGIKVFETLYGINSSNENLGELRSILLFLQRKL